MQGDKSNERFPSGDLFFSVTYLDDFDGVKQLPGEVNTRAPSNAIKPPTGIPVAYLENIKMIFTFSYFDMGFGQQCQYVNITKDIQLESLLADADNERQLDRLEGMSFGAQQIVHMHCLLKPVEQHLIDTSEDDLFEEVNDISVYAPRFERPLLDNVVHKFKQRFSIRDVRASRTPPIVNLEKYFFMELIALTDFGLQAFVQKASDEALDDIKLVASNVQQRIADVAPTLFKPGYLLVGFDDPVQIL